MLACHAAVGNDARNPCKLPIGHEGACEGVAITLHAPPDPSLALGPKPTPTETVVQEAVHAKEPDRVPLVPCQVLKSKHPTRFPLQELLTGDVNALRYVQRFSSALVHHREGVPEHSFYVALYSIFLVEWVRANTSLMVDRETVLMRALLHDLDECRTGDFVRSFKHSNQELKETIEECAQSLLWDVLDSLALSGERSLEMFVHATEAKDDTLEGAIIALADYLSVVSHLWQEINSGNATIYRHQASMLEHLSTFQQHRFNPLRPIINDLTSLVGSILRQDRRHQWSPTDRLPDVSLEQGG